MPTCHVGANILSPSNNPSVKIVPFLVKGIGQLTVVGTKQVPKFIASENHDHVDVDWGSMNQYNVLYSMNSQFFCDTIVKNLKMGYLLTQNNCHVGLYDWECLFFDVKNLNNDSNSMSYDYLNGFVSRWQQIEYDKMVNGYKHMNGKDGKLSADLEFIAKRNPFDREIAWRLREEEFSYHKKYERKRWQQRPIIAINSVECYPARYWTKSSYKDTFCDYLVYFRKDLPL